MPGEGGIGHIVKAMLRPDLRAHRAQIARRQGQRVEILGRPQIDSQGRGCAARLPFLPCVFGANRCRVKPCRRTGRGEADAGNRKEVGAVRSGHQKADNGQWIASDPRRLSARVIVLEPMAHQCRAIRRPVQRLAGRCVRSAHDLQLSRWIHQMNPQRDSCNRAS